ncbi:MBL fold metallo-hydrolase [Vibrio sp. SCSIO 43135]|uniref:MBL fold metallo-hydrolase n=1 Tax=Vibrio sp. SCSIO 43135 TaxID=2819096 RepID=UPI0020753C23|nr:MBL fold metallo-hydrolase [Vibrio sp. SCSIO 43135]USD43597.1 MBL fold metallo-hydrolase [Vibrio sp. SCSIO 43135]
MATQTIQHFFHADSGTISYVVSDTHTREAIIIDPVADYDVATNKVSFESAQKILDYLDANQLHVTAIMETHVHADHLSGSFHLSKVLGAPIHISEKVKEVYSSWKDELALSEMYHFEHLLLDQEHLDFGDSHLEVIDTPGHTPSDVTYKIGDALFVGDSLFHHGTGRADFPGGSAEKMFESLQKLYQLEDSTEVYLCHNYPDDEEHLIHKTTIGEEKHENSFLTDHTSKADFVEKRESRDHQLAQPKLISPALRYNLTAENPTNEYLNRH